MEKRQQRSVAKLRLLSKELMLASTEAASSFSTPAVACEDQDETILDQSNEDIPVSLDDESSFSVTTQPPSPPRPEESNGIEIEDTEVNYMNNENIKRERQNRALKQLKSLVKRLDVSGESKKQAVLVTPTVISERPNEKLSGKGNQCRFDFQDLLRCCDSMNMSIKDVISEDESNDLLLQEELHDDTVIIDEWSLEDASSAASTPLKVRNGGSKPSVPVLFRGDPCEI